MSILDNARRMASEGVAAFASHQAKRGPDKWPGRKVILSGVALGIESIGCKCDLPEQGMDVLNGPKVSVVDVWDFMVVIFSRKAVYPLLQVADRVLKLRDHGGVVVY